MSKKKYRKKADRLWIGIAVGIIVFVCMILLFFHSNKWDIVDDFTKVMKYLVKDSFALMKLAMLCVLPNSMLTFLSYRLELWDTYKGLMSITMISFIPFILFLF